MKRLMTLSLLALTSAMATATPPGGDWVSIGKATEVDFYVDKTSFQFDGQHRSLVLLQNFKSPVEGLGQRPSMIAKYDFDCSAGRMRMSYVKAYSEHNGLGRSGDSQEEALPWEPVPVAGLFRNLYKRTCARKS